MIIPGIFNKNMLSTPYSGRIKEFKHLDKNLLLGYIDGEDIIDFDKDQKDNSDRVLIKKLAFSLNYRDKELISLFYQRCQLLEEAAYAGIGSDFVAEIISCGSSVVNLSPGDRVIPNAAYPNTNAPNSIGGVPTNFASEEYEVLDSNQLVKVPNEMPLEVAAGFTIGAQTSYSIIRRLQIQAGTNFLVSSGRSNTSIFIIQALKALNIPCNVYVLTSAPPQKMIFFIKWE
jgi:NADPH:quinone reductase-like Zn-dependent oxidoreductase